jgi:hypothetical protein
MTQDDDAWPEATWRHNGVRDAASVVNARYDSDLEVIL